MPETPFGGNVIDVLSPMTLSKVPFTKPGVSKPRFLPSADVITISVFPLTGLPEAVEVGAVPKEARAVSWFGTSQRL